MRPVRSLSEVARRSRVAEQRAYTHRIAARSKFGLVVPEAFVRGVRDLGYRCNGAALAELVDNALQADANRVDVLFGYEGSTSDKKPTQLAVVDNGHGMEPAMIRMAVMWGGTHRENDRKGLGRFGYGLPCSSVSLGRCFTVISKVSGGGLYAVKIDLEEIAAGRYTNSHGEIVVPEPRQAALPEFVADHIARAFPQGWTSGTLILIESLDRLERVTTLGLCENLGRQLGTTYHKLRGEAELYVNGNFVEPIDPLFLTPEFHLHALDDDRAQALDPVRIEVKDPETGGYMGAMIMRYAWLPMSFGSIDKTRDAVGLNANARFSTMKEYHGIIFSRNGRLIDVQNRTPWTIFVNNDRYIKVEVEFTATLDEAFGVTTSKQQVTVSTWIWDLLRQAGMFKAIEQLRNKVKEMKAIRRCETLTPRLGQKQVSERATSTALAGGPSGGVSPSLEVRFETSRYRVELEHTQDQPFFRTENCNDQHILHINTNHRFYRDIYEGPAATPATRAALEALLFSLGDAMFEDTEEAQKRNQRQLSAWSRRLDRALAAIAGNLPAADKQRIGHAPWSADPS